MTISFRKKTVHLVNRFLTPVLAASLMVAAPLIHAKTSYTGTWSGIYPASSSDTNASCALCHTSTSGGGLNLYGVDINTSSAGALSARIVDVEGEDSDLDPTLSNNITEINANAQPGWTGAAPSGVIGDLDPAVNLSPVADANGPYNGTATITLITFDGTGSTDPDGSIVAYDWDFGDGNTGTGVNPVNTYAAADTYTVTLVVTDDGGLTDSATSTATIVPAPQDPIADPNGPYNGIESQVVVFDGSASFDPDGGSITQYDWDFGDGNTGTDVAPSHTYIAAGNYTVSLIVVDDEGAISTSATTTADIASDQDRDGTPDNIDNCILHANGPLIPDAGGNIQRDTDGDGYGNVCDPDFDNNLIVNAADLALFKTKFFTQDPDTDLNGDGIVNAGDLAILKSFFFKPPGPSGLVP